MNILIEINHPAHIHLFRNLADDLKEKNIPAVFMVKSEPAIKQLAAFYGLPVVPMGRKGKGLLQKYLYQLFFLVRSVMIARKIKAGLGLGVSMNLPLVSKFTSMPSIVLDDDDMNVTPVFAKYANQASVILTPSALAHENRGLNHIPYPGYHELAYLHPNRFTPDESVLDMLGVKKGERFFVVRLNAFMAHHDAGQEGMNSEQRKLVIERLKRHGRVFVSAEAPATSHQPPATTLRQAQGYAGGTSDQSPETTLRQALRQAQGYAQGNASESGGEPLEELVGPEMMHSVLAYATMYVGESQTMTSEAAVLGTPALKCNTFAGRLSIPNELEERYGLCYAYRPHDFDKMMDKIDALLALPDLKGEWQRRRDVMLKEKIDVTGFLGWFVEHYPASVETVQKEGEKVFARWKGEAD